MKSGRIAAILVGSVAALVIGIAVPTFAHHSQTMFDLGKTITLTGTVTKVDWANPHTFFYIQAKDLSDPNATVKNWGLEGQSPNFLIGNGEGWTAATIKKGDKITISGNPRKDGQPTLLLLNVTAADGKHYTSKLPLSGD